MNNGVFVNPEGDIEKSFENIIELVKIELVKDYFGFDAVSDEQINNWQDEYEPKLIKIFAEHTEYPGEFMLGNEEARKAFVEKIKGEVYQGQEITA